MSLWSSLCRMTDQGGRMSGRCSSVEPISGRVSVVVNVELAAQVEANAVRERQVVAALDGARLAAHSRMLPFGRDA